MKRRRVTIGLAIALGAVATLSALVTTTAQGTWPGDWPAELEPYRGNSSTIGVATGCQSVQYAIPVDTTEEFREVFAAALKVRTPNSPIRIMDSIGLASDGEEGRAFVSIECPPWGRISLGGTEAAEWKDATPLTEESVADAIAVPEDQLPPEWVAQDRDGSWIAFVDLPTGEERSRYGFFFKARTDITIQVGSVPFVVPDV